MIGRYDPFQISFESPTPPFMRAEDRPFIANCSYKLPTRFRSRALKRYGQVSKSGGAETANQFISRLADLSVRAGCSANITSDADIIVKAKRVSHAVSLAYRRHGYQAALSITHGHLDKQFLINVQKLKSEERIAKRLGNEHWWRSALRNQRKQVVETMGRDINLVNRYAGLYVTDESVKLRESQKAKNRTLMEECIALNERGQEYNLAILSDLSVSNPTIRRAELMVRLAGFDAYAKKSGHIGELLTITCPSRMHSSHSKSGKMNPKYDGTTPNQAQKYLTKMWARIRAKLHRNNITIYGFRVVEPNHDGTPHWHMVVFMEKKHREQVREIIRTYALKVDGDEPGAAKRRFDAKALDWKKGTAAAYLAKYIAKNIDGFGVGDDLYGNEATSSAKRVETWASTWNIRQFQQIGGPPVTVWRQLRKLRDAQSDDKIEPIRKAADESDWCAFLELMEDNPVRIERIYNDKLGRYDEPIGDQILGVSLGAVTYVTRLHEWTIGHRPAASPIGAGSSMPIGASIGSPIGVVPIGEFSNQALRAKRVLEFCH